MTDAQTSAPKRRADGEPRKKRGRAAFGSWVDTSPQPIQLAQGMVEVSA